MSGGERHKEAMSRLVRGAETRNGLAPHQCVVVENQEEYLSHGGPPRGMRDPAPHQAPQPGEQVPGRKSPYNILCVKKKSGDSDSPSETESYRKSRCPFQRPVHKLTCSQHSP